MTTHRPDDPVAPIALVASINPRDYAARSAHVALTASDVHVRYGGIEVLHGVRIALAYGTFSALVGPNGAGKTTLLDWCAGAATEASSGTGRLSINAQQKAESWSAARRAKAGLRYVPFERNLFPGLSVLDNIRATAAPEADVDPVFETFPELDGLRTRTAGVLSGGERQLLAVACALYSPGRILLLDEPTHALAPEPARRVVDALARTAREDGRAVLVAEPSLERVGDVADFVWPLDRGRRLPAMGA